MKNIAMFTLLGLISFNSFAAEGFHTEGYVFVNSSITSMTGHFNVRFNPKPDHETSYIYGVNNVGGDIRFGGKDGRNNRQFICRVSPTSEHYAQAMHVVNNLGDGARLQVTRENSINSRNIECTGLSLTKHSKHQQ